MNRAIRRQAARSVGKRPVVDPAIDDLFVPGHVVEPLRSELVAKIHRRLRESGLMFTDVAFWVDMVAWAINERLDEHGGRNSATPMEAVR